MLQEAGASRLDKGFAGRGYGRVRRVVYRSVVNGPQLDDDCDQVAVALRAVRPRAVLDSLVRSAGDSTPCLSEPRKTVVAWVLCGDEALHGCLQDPDVLDAELNDGFAQLLVWGAAQQVNAPAACPR